MVILNLFNFVQFAHARHSSSKLGSALAQSQISGSVRGEGQEKARCQMLKQVQHDIWRHLLFILSFWGSQFNTSVEKTHGSLLITHNSKRSYVKSHRSPLISVPLKILYKTVFSYKSSWKVESAQLENFYFPVGKLFFLSWKIKISQ